MEPENQSPPSATTGTNNIEPIRSPGLAELASAGGPNRGLRWILIGSHGLRAGWSALLFIVLFTTLNLAIDLAMFHLHLISSVEEPAPVPVFFAEAGSLLALLIAVVTVGLIEGRRILAYNLTGQRRRQHFFFGLAAGFLALSALVGTLAAGGWLHFGRVALSGTAIFRYGLLWGCTFLVVGCVEEGMFRCYGLFTLARGLNFWWALGAVGLTCAYLAIFVGGSASWGVYAAALLGLIPCLVLHQKSASHSGGGGFWYAAWVTSTLFGYVHVSNPNEAWIGIFAAAFIGFVFCVSVRVTGSAWWAIGCHAGWDWGETYLYGTADSGLTPHGCYLSSSPAGNALWSGGAVGPEGSLLVLAAILLLLALVLLYGRWTTRYQGTPAALAAAD